MKTKTHMIQGASLGRLEELHGYGTPDWVPHTVAIPGTETSALDECMVQTKHFSGLLREVSRCEYIEDNTHVVVDEDGGLHDLEELLEMAAERLDQAHQEWGENEHNKWKHPANVIDIEVRNVYGIDRFYPASDKAREMADMLYGRKTLNQDDLIKLHEIFGFEIRLTNAVAHEWLKFATSKLAVQS